MKILLVKSTASPQSVGVDNYFLVEPLALEYLGAAVKENHDVRLLDLRVKTEPGLAETLETFEPDIVGCGGCTADVFPTRELFAEVKKIVPGALTVIGGHHASIIPRDFFDENTDVVVMGEGVHPFREICRCCEKKQGFEHIENIWYRNPGSGEMMFTRQEEHPPLDSIPLPDRSLTAHIRDKYNYPVESGIVSMASIRGSTGCIYRCKFCSIQTLMNRKVYKRSIDSIVGELASIKEPIIFWTDDEFLLEPERAVAIAREIGRAGIDKTHVYFGRADNIVRNPECVEEWAKVGLLGIYIGLESHRQSDLKAMRKGLAASKNEEAIRIMHANNVQVRGNFIVQPDFDKEDFRKLAEYSRELDIEYPGFTIMTPFPGTELYEEVKDNLITDNYNLFDISHTVLPTKLPLKEFYEEYSDIFFKSLSEKRKTYYMERMAPKARQEFMSWAKSYHERLRNAYLDY